VFEFWGVLAVQCNDAFLGDRNFFVTFSSPE
jgi:hypothetical protein